MVGVLKCPGWGGQSEIFKEDVLIVILSLIIAAVVIEYGFYLHWREFNDSLGQEEGEKSVFEFF